MPVNVTDTVALRYILKKIEGAAMKRTLLVATFLALMTGIAFAGGDKVRGENGQGNVNQHQINDPPPFEDAESFDFFAWLLE